MDEYNKLVGKRILEIRNNFNEGTKLSATQFAHLLGTTRDKITNYENGRSAVPVSLLYALYIRGINPVYIISGKEDIFAHNPAGDLLRERFQNKQKSEMLKTNFFKLDDEKYQLKGDIHRVAAGIIKSSDE